MGKLAKIYFGIAAESRTDAYIYQKLIEKILNVFDNELFFPNSYIFVTDRDSKVGKGRIRIDHLKEIANFFEKKPRTKLKIVVIATDHDRGEAENINLLTEKASSLINSVKIIVTQPRENIESWIMQDIGTVNKVLEIKNGALSKKEIEDPKDLLNSLCGSVKINEVEARRKIAKLMNIQNIKTRDFEEFKKQIVDSVRMIIDSPAIEIKELRRKIQKQPIQRINKQQANEIIILLKRINNKMNRLLKGR